jgi:DNA-binding CsgD family transcriptional regulator/PAS domain-containing protein
MGDSEDTAFDLVGKVYDAALDEKKWPSFLEAFAQAVGGCSSLLRSADLQTGVAGYVATFGYDPAWKEAYCSHFVKLDYFNIAMNQYAPGTIFSSDQHVDLSKLRKSEYYNDYLVPQDKVHAFGIQLHREGSRSLVLGIQRGKRAGAFGEEEMRLLNILAPHVTRAVQVHRKLGSLTLEKEWALGALDQLRVGVILTDSLGMPLFVNRAAEQMMAQGKGISLSQGRLALNNPTETTLLHKLIANAAQGAAIGGDMRITLPNRSDVLQCLVTPVSPEFSARLNIYLGSGCAAIFLSKPGSLQLSPKRLAVLYGLSPAESRLVAKLAELNSLEQTANDLGIALGTARSQLASVFAKTGAKGQAELLMFMATGTLAYCRDT